MEFLKKHHNIISSPPTLWQACNTNCSSSQEQLFFVSFQHQLFSIISIRGRIQGTFQFQI